MRMMKRRLIISNNTKGAIDTILLGVVLPILILLVAAVVDLARIPIAKDRLREALMMAAYNAEAETYRKGEAAEEGYDVLCDAFTPAGNNICSETDGVGDCGVSAAKSSFLTLEVSTALVESACQAVKYHLQKGGSGLFNFIYSAGEESFGIQYAIVRFDTANDGALTGVTSVATSTNTCGGDFNKFSSIDENNFDSALAMTTLKDQFVALVAGNSTHKGAGAWLIDDDYTGPGASYMRWLPSYWVIGVGYLKVDHFFGTLFGGGHTIVDYFIRPISAPAGIQKTVEIEGQVDC